MHINLESRDLHSIKAYSDTQVKISDNLYDKSLIVSKDLIVDNWPIQSISDLNEDLLAPLLQLKPKVIIIGSNENKLAPYPLIAKLSEKQIGLESMSIGAASRTFNVLLSEDREVVLGLILR